MAVILDPQISGISGNMVIGSLIDIGVDESDVIDVMEYYGSFFGDLNVKICRVKKSGISASYVQVESSDSGDIEYRDLMRKLENIRPKRIDVNVLNFAKSVFKTISTAEAKVHGISLGDVHFHEVGAADAVADIIGASYCFYNLGFNEDKVYGMPVALGGGRIQIKHGNLSVPAPATLEILKNMPVFGGPEEYELTTPTGAALYANMVDETCPFYPLMFNEKIGYGAGRHDLKSPNILRVISGHLGTPTDNVSILETNIDNISAEVIGHTFHKLQHAGALDVTVIPLIMKKNRPGHLLRAITKPENCDSVAEAIIRETGTLGVRIMPYVHRNIVNREITPIRIKINKVDYKIKIKIGKIGEDIINYSPEYEDARRIAEETGMPLKDVMKRANETFKKMME